MHLVFAFASIYFPIELWIKKNAHYKTANVCASWFIAAFYYAGIESQILASLGFLFIPTSMLETIGKELPFRDLITTTKWTREPGRNSTCDDPCRYIDMLSNSSPILSHLDQNT
eukprot:UN00189